MEPEIITQPATKLVGIASRYDSADLDLPRLWSAFRPYRNSISNQTGEDAFGIYESYEEQGDEISFSYVCTVPVSNFDQIPDGMTARELPEQMYARFTHTGPVANLDKTLKHIWGSWLPKSNYNFEEKPDFELYQKGFNDADPKNELYLHIPIKAKQ